MINSISGKITGKYPQLLHVETSNGIEWEFSVSDSTLNSVGNIGDNARIFCVLHHKDDAMRLFGFSTIEERSVYSDLLKVEGVGPKGALKILSNMPYENLVKILEDEDFARLEKIPGIGKKTAQKMLLSLKGKLTLFSEGQSRILSDSHGKSVSIWNDVIVALTDMGYDKTKVEQVVEKISIEISSDLTKSQKEELIFRKAIVELAL